MNFLSKKSAFAYSVLALSMLAIEANAAAIQSLSASQASDNATQIRISFDGAPVAPVAYQQAGSNQLVLDFNNVTSSGLPREMPINRGVVDSVTALNGGSSTRLMVNLNSTAKYTSSVEGNNLVLRIANDGNSRAVQPASNNQAMNVKVNPLLATTARSMPSNHDGVSSVNYSGNRSGGGNVTVGLTNEAVPVDLQRQGNKIVIRTQGSTIPRHLVRQIQAGGLVSSIGAVNQGQSGVITINMTGDFEHKAYQSGSMLHISIAPPKRLQTPGMEEKVYTGEPLSMEFQDVPVRSVLSVLSEFTKDASNPNSGFDIVAADNVQGNITLRLVNVPWDQALDVILKTKNLGMRKNGRVIWVAPEKELTDAEAKVLEDARRMDELLPLRTEYIRLNYTTVADVMKLINEARAGNARNNNNYDVSLLASSRGVIATDARTNTIIIKDTAPGIDSIRALIEKIDIPMKQVMIEARIVTATESFSKEIGVQWGTSNINNGGSLNVNNMAWTPARNGGANPFSTGSTGFAVNLNPSGSGAGAITVGLLSISDVLLDLSLAAMQAERRGEVISAPKVLTADKQTAKISSGKQIPYQEASASGASTTSFQEAALSLEATPNITPDGRISIKLDVRNADTTGEVYSGVPVIREDALSTNVLLDDGQTIVLGGVFRNTTSDGKTKVPFLGDLPGVGRLFKSDTKSNNKEELLIFITPKLINDGVSRID